MAIGMDAYNPEYSGIWMPNSSAKSVSVPAVFSDPKVQAWSSSLYDPSFSGVVSPESAPKLPDSVVDAYKSGNLLDAAAELIDPSVPTDGQTVYRRSSGNRRAQPVNYIDAPIAERYGMNAQTAYNESLANTAHQREVQDLLKAGLNPVLSARYGGSSAPSTILVPNSGSGAHSGSGGYSSAKSLDGFTRLIKGVAPELVGLVVGQATSRSTGNSAKNITKGLLNALF